VQEGFDIVNIFTPRIYLHYKLIISLQLNVFTVCNRIIYLNGYDNDIYILAWHLSIIYVLFCMSVLS